MKKTIANMNLRRKIFRVVLFGFLLIFATACSSTVRFSSKEQDKPNVPPHEHPWQGDHSLRQGKKICGVASYYADKFVGLSTASGEIYDPSGLTAAHRSLPFGSSVRVTNLKNGRQVVVRINDRGPVKTDRLIDLSKAAAQRIDMLQDGIVEVELLIIEIPTH